MLHALRLKAFCAALAVVAWTAACTREECRSVPGQKPGILVIDQQSHDSLCNAIVIAKDGDYEEIATSTVRCDGIYGLSGRAGVYVVSATAPGYQKREETVRIEESECGLKVENDGPREGYPGFAYTVTFPLVPE